MKYKPIYDGISYLSFVLCVYRQNSGSKYVISWILHTYRK